MSNLILFNANILTMDPIFPRAQFVAIQGNKILSVSGGKEFHKLRKTNTQVIDCHGKTIVPGFIDAHCHLFSYAENLTTVSLDPRNKIHSISDMRTKIQSFCQGLPPGTWIRGNAYNEFYFAEKRHPNRKDLDEATTIHPIKLTHRTGHAHVLNSLALKLVGITEDTPDPPGGLIDRDIHTGEPTGVLYGMSNYLAKIIPHIDKQQMEQGIKLVNQELLSFGITSIQDTTFRNDLGRWEMFGFWKDQGLLRSRVNMMLGIEGFKQFKKQPFSIHTDPNQLRLGGVKIIVHEITGQLTPNQNELNELVLQIHQSGFQSLLHAIEERTIEASCCAIEYALKASPRSDHRHRIEHCAVCPPLLLKRLASLGIMVVTQPSFIYYNGDQYLKTVPSDQLNHLYPIATLMKKGIKVAASSDFPLAPPNPLIGIYSAVSRTAEIENTILPGEGITPFEALQMYTQIAAEASFEDKIKGSIAPGKLADLVILSEDPTILPANEIKNVKVETTILNGEIVWNKIG
jgi:predicted amidohydrolase YtcJ